MDIAIDSQWIFYPHKNKLLENGRILIEDDKIIYSGPRDHKDAKTSGHDKYDFPHGITIPGLVNAHTHLPETLLRGVCDDQPLQTWLYDYIWKIEPQMRPEDAYWGSMLGIAEMLSSGTVAFNDQYFYARQIARAASETGIKAMLSPSIFYKGNPESPTSMEEAFQNAKKTFSEWNGKHNRIWIGYGPHAPYTVDKEWFLRLAEEARKNNTILHTHFNETQYEIKEAEKNWGKRPIEYIADLGILDVTKSAAHCIYLSDKEIELLRKYDVSVLHCPKSNLKIAAGIANVPKLLDSRVNVCLGTDGQASNNKLCMLEEIAMEVLIHKGVQLNPLVLPGYQALQMATTNAAKLFPSGVYAGTLEANTPADLTVIDLDSVPTTPIINPVSHLTYAVTRENVALTIVNGEILYEYGVFPLMNIAETRRRAQKASEMMREKAAERKN